MKNYLFTIGVLIFTTANNAYAIGTGGIDVASDLAVPIIGISIVALFILAAFWLKLTLTTIKSKNNNIINPNSYITLTTLIVLIAGFSAFFFVQLSTYFIFIAVIISLITFYLFYVPHAKEKSKNETT